MTKFVIMAAGRGTRIGRVGDSLHKALVPLAGKAVLSHIIELAPRDSEVVILLGHKAEQIMDYVAAAHPDQDVSYILVLGYDRPGSGPGQTLLEARGVVGDHDMYFTSCDTIWDKTLQGGSTSWSAVAPVPAGTDLARWCRMRVRGGLVKKIVDKHPTGGDMLAYTGLSYIRRQDLSRFWDGILSTPEVAGERQVTGGLTALADSQLLGTRRIQWTDVGDDAAYHDAVLRWEGYDFTKEDTATYVLPETGRVVKFWKDVTIAEDREMRARILHPAVPLCRRSGSMLSYPFIAGESAYQAIERQDPRRFIVRLLDWAHRDLWKQRQARVAYPTCLRFYRDKTYKRIAMLDVHQRRAAYAVVDKIDWYELCNDAIPATIHGDLNLGNIIVPQQGGFVGIDWREDFGGSFEWGDMRYDLAKLLAGMVVNWDNAQRGDFRPWRTGKVAAREIRAFLGDRPDIERIAALSLLNSAPLHAAPLDDILLARGCAWLAEYV